MLGEFCMRNFAKEMPGSNLVTALFLVFMAMFAISGLFEIIWQIYFPESPGWQIALLTVFFVSISSSVIAYFPLRVLIHTEAHLKTILSGSPALQFAIDTEHRVLFWNKAMELYSGIRAQDVIGTMDHWKAFYPDKRPCLVDLLIDSAIEKLPEWYEGKITRSPYQDGAYEVIDYLPFMGKKGYWLYFTAIPVRDPDGTLIGAVETLIDITERKNAEFALQKSEDRFITFIREAAMRLKTPLTVVEENLSLLASDIETNSVPNPELMLRIKLQIKNVEQIRKNVNDLNAMIIEHDESIPEKSRKFLIE